MLKKLKKINKNLINTQNITNIHDNIIEDANYIRWNVSGISGNINDCQITDEDRKNIIKIEDLIE